MALILKVYSIFRHIQTSNSWYPMDFSRNIIWWSSMCFCEKKEKVLQWILSFWLSYPSPNVSWLPQCLERPEVLATSSTAFLLPAGTGTSPRSVRRAEAAPQAAAAAIAAGWEVILLVFFLMGEWYVIIWYNIWDSVSDDMGQDMVLFHWAWMG